MKKETASGGLTLVDSLDSKDDSGLGCQNSSHQQHFSELPSPPDDHTRQTTETWTPGWIQSTYYKN